MVVAEDGEDEQDETASDATAFGTIAKPFVHEGFPTRPPYPTMGWLMKQLEKRSVGTGATRTSTYAEVTNNATGKALMREQRGKITLSAVGELNHRILPGTRIGDLSITEKGIEQMAQVEAGTAAAPDFLALVEGPVRHDLEKMKANASRLPAELKERMAKAGVTRALVENITLPPALHFTHGDAVVTTAKRVFCGHRFADAEVAALLAGQVIEITAISPKSGKPFICKGTLEAGVTEKGYPFVGFKPQFAERPPRTDLVSGVWKGKKVEFKGRGGEPTRTGPAKTSPSRNWQRCWPGRPSNSRPQVRVARNTQPRAPIKGGSHQCRTAFGRSDSALHLNTVTTSASMYWRMNLIGLTRFESQSRGNSGTLSD